MEEIDAAVANWLRENIITEVIVIATLREVRKRLAKHGSSGETELPALASEVTSLERQLSRLADALAVSDEKPETILKTFEMFIDVRARSGLLV
jgi:hypothetical protein